MARGAHWPRASFLPPSLRNPMNSFPSFPSGAAQVDFTPPAGFTASPPSFASETETPPTVSEPGRAHCMGLLPSPSAHRPGRGSQEEGDGGRGAELCAAPGRRHQAAKQMASDECVRTCHVLRWQRGSVTWGELMTMLCSHYAAQCSSFSHHFTVSALLFLFCFFLISQTN